MIDVEERIVLTLSIDTNERVVLNRVRKSIEEALGSKSVSSIPPWPLVQFLPPVTK